MDQSPKPVAIPSAGRFLFVVFGLVFGGIGITVLAFVWGGDDGFGSPPLFFKVFASFIAIAFVAFGGTMAFSSFKLKSFTNNLKSPTAPPVAGAYKCPHCGASLGGDTEVSPLGDVKCSFCGSWFNIHRPGM